MSRDDPKSDRRPSGFARSARRRSTAAGTGASSAGGAGGSMLVPTPGMAMVQDAVRFTNAEVLDPTKGLSGEILPTGMQLGANSLADQAGAMMIQDMRSFLQSIEMVIVPATALALSESLEGDPAGAETVGLIQTLLTELPVFAGAIIAEAGETKTVFS
jgi:hypothetical protein